jgi:hypothetical protein
MYIIICIYETIYEGNMTPTVFQIFRSVKVIKPEGRGLEFA